jgi:hypothetical protein
MQLKFCQIFIQHFFKIVLHWCWDLIRHYIGTHLKLNKYIFDISIPFCHHLYLSATLKQCFTEFAVYGNVDLPSCLHVSTRPNSYVRFDWSVIFRVRFENQNILCNPDPKNNRPIKSHVGIRPTILKKCCMKIWTFETPPLWFFRVVEG